MAACGHVCPAVSVRVITTGRTEFSSSSCDSKRLTPKLSWRLLCCHGDNNRWPSSRHPLGSQQVEGKSVGRQQLLKSSADDWKTFIKGWSSCRVHEITNWPEIWEPRCSWANSVSMSELHIQSVNNVFYPRSSFNLWCLLNEYCNVL